MKNIKQLTKVIIFDFDGVIENNYELHYEMSKSKFVDLTRDEHKSFFESNLEDAREKISHRDTGFDIKKHFSDAKGGMVTNENVKDVLVSLSKKYILGISTLGMEYGVNSYLSNNKIKDLFSFVYGYESGKLKSETFKKIFQEFGVTNEECIFVTDTLVDILEANKVGIKTVAVDFGFHERERLEKGSPYRIISNFEELSELL